MADWGLGEYGAVLQGVGSLANAWGNFESEKKKNKFLENQFAYEKQKDANAAAKLEKAQVSLDNAFDNSAFGIAAKKKKNADGTDAIDPFAAPSVSAIA